VSPTLTWDERTRRIFGIPNEPEVSFDTFLQIVDPEDRDAVSRRVQEAMDPAGNGNFETEYRIVHPDNRRRWVRAVGRVYFEGQGSARHPVRFLGTVQDITERKRAEGERERLIAELETERARLEQIFTEAPAVMALYSGPEHIITVVNPTWEQTVGKPDVVGRPFREVFPELAGSGLFELLDQVYETGEAFVDTEVNVPLERWGSGVLEDTYWNLVWRPLAGGGEQERDILVHAVEVTDQVVARQEVERKAEELARLARQLEASNRELDQFAYVASHDLRAPLRGIANLSSWIEEDLGDHITEEAREHLEMLRGRVRRMEGLIDGILQYSRAGRVREEPEPVDVGALLNEVVDLLSPPGEFQIRIGEAMPTLASERLPLQQVFMNLIGNAIKYNRNPNPWVEIRVQEHGTQLEFAVADNGPGIAPEYHERIFGIFQTLQARDEVEGTGIGLSLVRKLVETRGGRIWVESAEGVGSTFHFTWPKENMDVAAD
jgi:PAS domain S-box-containing protein